MNKSSVRFLGNNSHHLESKLFFFFAGRCLTKMFKNSLLAWSSTWWCVVTCCGGWGKKLPWKLRCPYSEVSIHESMILIIIIYWVNILIGQIAWESFDYASHKTRPGDRFTSVAHATSFNTHSWTFVSYIRFARFTWKACVSINTNSETLLLLAAKITANFNEWPSCVNTLVDPRPTIKY